MAARPQISPQDNTGSSVLAQFPPPISLASPVLASVISLPENPLIIYSVFSGPPASVPDHLTSVELARKKIVHSNANRAVVDSLLPSVHIAKDIAALYVFAIGRTDRTSESHAALAALQLDGVILTQSSSFTPSSIYPCSVTCSIQSTPCHECLNSSRINLRPISSSSSAPLRPRHSIRAPFHHFLQAVRDRLISDITEASMSGWNNTSITRLKDGFLLGPSPASSEWGAGWESSVRNRPLIYCHLQVYLSQLPSSLARLVIHPIMRPTYYLPIHCTIPLPPGTPITLLPHGLPAYYLSTYAGPASALTSQFEDALVGLGAGDWKRASSSRNRFDATGDETATPTYIIVWLSIQNKQGEDKGIPIIWPVRLCLSFHPTSPSPHARTPLLHIPDLPAQLQASPPPPPPMIPTTLVASSSSRSHSRAGTPLSQAQPSQPEHDRASDSILRRPRTSTSSPTSEALRAFRTLTLAKPYTRDIKKVATEVSGYVESVAKERERERERIKREREGRDNASRGRTGSASGGTAPAVSQALPEPTPSAPEEKMNEAPTPVVVPEPDVVMETQPEPQSPSGVSSADSLFSPPDMPIDIPAEDEVLDASFDKVPQPEVDNTSAPIAGSSTALPDPSGGAISAFDPFGNFDAPWGVATNDFMGMNMDYDMGFGMSIDPLGGGRMGGGGGGSFDMDDGFGVFTDDDFNFFDGPTAQTRTTAPAPPPLTAATNPVVNLAQPIPILNLPPVDQTVHMSGPGPPVLPSGQSSSWIVQPLGDAFEPHHNFPAYGALVPDLLPPTPSKTPASSSAPATPTVQLSDQIEATSDRNLYQPALGPSVFDPIAFASSHRVADGKYVIGKFALSSPPDEEDRTEPMLFAPSRLLGWKSRYSAATDPRVGLVRKLIGVKRKSFDQGTREARMSPSWVREHEEWESSSPTPVAEDIKSEVDSDEDEPWAEEDDQATLSRPSTPAPSYLPLGPTLLQTHFHHSILLPLSTPLRPPGSAVSHPSGTAITSVPTPVSPAAVLGAASEKAKSLESAASMLFKEVVENSVWADTWRAHSATNSAAVMPPTQIWPTDVRWVSKVMASIRSAQSPVDLQTLYTSAHTLDPLADMTVSLEMLESPMVTLGKADTVIQVLPPALRFWEKLGLGPRAGRKDVAAFVFFEERPGEQVEEVSQWLDRVSSAYAAKNFGTHTPGISGSVTNGLVPMRFDSLRKTLLTFVSTLSHTDKHLVFYIISPVSITTLASTTLRQLFSAVKRVFKTHIDARILFHFVPESLVSGDLTDPRSCQAGLESFVTNVYDRILQPVERSMSRNLFGHARTLAYFQAPAFTLVRPMPFANHGQRPSITFVPEARASTLDVLDRHTLLHVGYQLSPCGRWLLAACVDARGESHDLSVWIVSSDAAETFVATKVWEFVSAFASRADVEWRIVISKLGPMSARELDLWVAHLQTYVTSSDAIPPWYVTLLAVEHEIPWTLLAPSAVASSKRPSSPPSTSSSTRGTPRAHSGSVFAEINSSTYALFHPAGFSCMPSSRGSAFCPGSSDLPFIPDCEDDVPAQQKHPYLRARGMSTLVFVPAGTDHTSVSMVHIFRLHSARMQRSTYGKRHSTVPGKQFEASEAYDEEDEETLRDVTRNFHELAVLGRLRWKLPSHNALPFHLAALEVMRVALCGENVGE